MTKINTTTAPQTIILQDLPREAAPLTRGRAVYKLLAARAQGAATVTIRVEDNEYTITPQLALDLYDQLRTDIVPEVKNVNFNN